jgi:hypothetical protein
VLRVLSAAAGGGVDGSSPSPAACQKQVTAGGGVGAVCRGWSCPLKRGCLLPRCHRVLQGVHYCSVAAEEAVSLVAGEAKGRGLFAWRRMRVVEVGAVWCCSPSLASCSCCCQQRLLVVPAWLAEGLRAAQGCPLAYPCQRQQVLQCLRPAVALAMALLRLLLHCQCLLMLCQHLRWPLQG